MASLEDLEDLERRPDQDGDASMTDAGSAPKKPSVVDEEFEGLDPEILNGSVESINTRRRLLENEVRMMTTEFKRLSHEKSTMVEKIKDNKEKIENNRFVPVEYNALEERSTNGDMPGNYHTLSATSSRSWKWTLKPKPAKKEQTLT